jgi:hypothetical protein
MGRKMKIALKKAGVGKLHTSACAVLPGSHKAYHLALLVNSIRPGRGELTSPMVAVRIVHDKQHRRCVMIRGDAPCL